ncbi:glycosyltransferase family 2 protein [Fischerella thermalis]|uniref:glycosyltransferase family 2 protein n=1 Tax=Fischerella thermalis TaxID=372787 RepID=UPI001A090185|nr:glycosyltransferase [Fischerella thermalis]MBF1991414.1 glycosyltransferase [Fischerella thermalis M58_A2018_009]MBF2061041.1 glycosyltransferase [Fischerella thermalis M66_A2018_004]MBF2069117.1 glycosyltransferase [Fischerella thermalis M48_A2018_028]
MLELQTEKLQPIKLPQLLDNPLVSVLIANYNYEKYISQTLESVLRQTYQNFEIIVCDDGSTDNSCDVIANYVRKDSRIKLISKQNGGVASALNAAYQKSQGQIICLLDADDIWMDRKLEKVVNEFKTNLQAGFVIHNVVQIDSEGKLIKPHPMYKNLASGWMGVHALENGGFINNIPQASALSLRREIADYIFPLNEEFRRNADSLIFRCAPYITVIGSVPDVLNQFRLHGSNTTSVAIVSADFIEKSQTTIARVHQEQKQFLLKVYGTEIAERLKDWRCSLIVCQNLYLLARLKGASKLETRKAHQQLINHPEFYQLFGRNTPHTWLLKWGEFLPDAIFKMLFDQIYGSGSLRRFVGRFRRKKLFVSRVAE